MATQIEPEDYGAVENAECTSELQAAIDAASSEKKELIVRKKYYAISLTGRDYLQIRAICGGAIWPWSNATLFYFEGKHDFVVDGLYSEGFAALDWSTHYPTIADNGCNFIHIKQCDNFCIRDLRLRRFAGAGIKYEDSYGAFWGHIGHFHRIRMREMHKAVHCYNRGEYGDFVSVHAAACFIGFHVDAGNTVLDACQVVMSGDALYITGGVNNGHGTVNGGNYNHNNINLDCLDLDNGMTISGANFIGAVDPNAQRGRLRITNSRGVNVTGGQIKSDIIVDGGAGTRSGENNISHNFIFTEQPPYVAPQIINGGKVRFKDNFDAAGAWAYNN